MLKLIEVIPLDEASVDAAVAINTVLKRKRKQIDIADLFIAATAISFGVSLATLNKRHFERVENLTVI